MASFEIKVTADEKLEILKALREINNMEHVSHISYATFASISGIKETKVRAIIVDMVDNKELQQVDIAIGKVPRYYYVATDKGLAIKAEEA